MPDDQLPEQRFPVRLTQAQRKVIAGISPELTQRLNLTEADQRTIPLTLDELKAIRELAGRAIRHAGMGMKRNSLRHVADLTAKALDRCQGNRCLPAASGSPTPMPH